MKVCVATEFYPSSAVFGTVKELTRQGVEVVVFTSQHDLFGRVRAKPKVTSGSETVYYTPSIYVPQIPYALVPRALQDFVRIIKQEKVDIIHAQMFAFYTIPNVTPLIKEACKIPLVLTFHGLQHEAFVNPFYRIGMSFYYRLYFRVITNGADIVITLSRLSREKALKLGANPNKVVVLPNGVDLNLFYPSNELRPAEDRFERLTVVYVGRISAAKGVFVMLGAAKKLSDKYGDRFSFLFAGDGPDRTIMQDFIQNAKLSNVTLLGHVNNVRELLTNSDLFVLPSLYEGLPLSLLEAMACKIPVVVTSVGDIPALINNGQNGVLVPPRDVGSLVHALEKLADDDSYRKKLAENAYEIIKKNYSLERMVNQLKEVYQSLLNRIGNNYADCL